MTIVHDPNKFVTLTAPATPTPLAAEAAGGQR